MIVANIMDKYKTVSEILENGNLQDKLDFYIKENYQLKQKINLLEKEVEALQKNSSRGAGRKSKLEDHEKNNVFELWLSGDMTIKELAERFNCSTRTIDRILKDRREEK